ncbi:disease resistance protein [Nitrincola tibetensis]|uniref:Disease resistance protein n=2 Tax=Nitrincola tibetensis TaxID=2219697 RepID=A0A364NJC0_9GAMM|nr:disease resistance protein [Nitrincola tibetensis]
MNRTHWAVKDEDLFSRLYAAGLIDQKFINPVGRTGKLEELRFKVAFSFPGEVRECVLSIVNRLKSSLPTGSIFYDDDFTAQLARPNLDSLLQTVYLKNSDLIVVFLSGDYERKMWCGIEWRAIRGIINNKSDHAIMFVRSDDAEIPGIFEHDGYIDLNRFNPEQVADFILVRVRLNEQ